MCRLTLPAMPAGYTTLETANLTALLSTYTNGGQTIGPWLKDVPNNPGHYTIAVTDNAGTVANVDGAGAPVVGPPVGGCAQVS